VKPPDTMCFDVKTGYLVKTTAHVKSEMGESRFDSILSEYRADGPVKSAHYIQTVVGGQPLNIEITQVVVNAPLPEVPSICRTMCGPSKRNRFQPLQMQSRRSARP